MNLPRPTLFFSLGLALGLIAPLAWSAGPALTAQHHQTGTQRVAGGTVTFDVALINRGTETLSAIVLAPVQAVPPGSGILKVGTLQPGESRTLQWSFVASGPIFPLTSGRPIFFRGMAQDVQGNTVSFPVISVGR